MRWRASISNIAWPVEADSQAIRLAAGLGFSGIELAPGKVFGPLATASTAAMQRYRDELAALGLAVPALQAILFGVSGAHLFESAEARDRLFGHLTRVAEVAGILGAKACVFGSPNLRDPGERPVEEALDIAAEFFGRLAPHFAAHGTTLALEANPPLYKCRFITHTEAAVAFVARVGAAGFGLHLDTGTVLINDEDMATVEAAGRVAVHCHASEPDLVPLGRGATTADHARIADALRRGGYEGWVSVEMRSTDGWDDRMREAAFLIDTAY